MLIMIVIIIGTEIILHILMNYLQLIFHTDMVFQFYNTVYSHTTRL